MNLAARMEQHCQPMEIVLCDPLYSLIRNDFAMTPRGEAEIKGFGACQLYVLDAPAAGALELP